MNKKRINGTCLIAFCFTVILAGCTNTQHQVLAATGTVIGIDISQDPATGAPHAKIGYDRAELAVVPTNRSLCAKKKDSAEPICTQLQREGAKDTTDVLMELRFKSNLTFQGDAGIYQRLAVGSNAVRQPGAAFMFSKNDNGDIDKNVAKYFAQAQEELKVEQQQLDKILVYVSDGSGAINALKLNDLIDRATLADPRTFSKSVISNIKNTKTPTELSDLLSELLFGAISPIYKSLPPDNQ